MVVTINTDASFRHTTGEASYAFKIICDVGIYYCCGPMKTKSVDSTDAEFKAVINAVTAAFKLLRPSLKRIGRIVINTDSLNVIQSINGNPGKYEHLVNMLIMEFNRNNVLIKKLHMRHVKAHTGMADGRSKVNEWCDQAAKYALKSKKFNFEYVQR